MSLSVVDAVFSYRSPPLLLHSFLEAAAFVRRRCRPCLSTPSSATKPVVALTGLNGRSKWHRRREKMAKRQRETRDVRMERRIVFIVRFADFEAVAETQSVF
ncbi:hypothetical protein Dsin_019315 [Dipteronia sinensis]|uniref:Uncharacterized protein n=1 Tax=Dipteronia sinensis TaxID=43782 RepID=A0AAE0A7Q5_9ROSI|nr:hypothetical protein Dsin_019315 [Dipteronia sinensis]